MSEVKNTSVTLISVKRHEEDSYSYNNNGNTFGTSATAEKQEVVRKMSKKERKLSEKEEKKEKKKREKEQKEREKENKKIKNSKKRKQKENTSEMETGGLSTTVVGDGYVNTAVSKETLNENNEITKEVNDRTSVDSGMDTSNVDNSPVNGPTDTNLDDHVIEDTITAEGADQAHEAPADILMYRKQEAAPMETEQGQHVEIEISEITEDEPEDPHDNMTYQNGSSSENEIVVVIIPQVECGPELDKFILETYGEEGLDESEVKRKSVRFQEEHEEIKDYESHEEEEEEEERVHPQGEPIVEILTKEKRENVESSEFSWDDILNDDNPSAHHSEASGNEVFGHLEDVENDGENIQSEKEEAKKDCNVVVIAGHHKIAAHHEVVDDHRNDVENHREDVDDHREDVDDHREDVDDHREDVDDHREDVDDHREDVDDHREDVDDHREDVDDHREDVDDHRKDDNGHLEAVNDHQEAVVDHRNDVDDNTNDVDDDGEAVDDHREVVVDHRYVIGDHDEDASQRGEVGKASNDNINNNAVIPNRTGSKHEKKVKKDRSERSRLWRCCYP